MRPALTRDQSRAFDRRATDALGVPGLLLMENAGAGATEVLLDRLGDACRAPVVIGGTGQNGGDAWVVARHLLVRGITPRAFLIGDPGRVGGDAAVCLEALRRLGHGPTVVPAEGDRAPLRGALAGATAIVDGLFGTGLDRPVRGGRTDVLEGIAAADAPVLALDLPSGVDADTGASLGPAPPAAVTATFGSLKRGLVQHPGAALAGEVRVVPLGVPGIGFDPEAPDQAGLADLSDVGAWLPARTAAAHKGSAGHVLVVAGAPGKTGAAVLAGRGAMRGGAGLVTIASRGAARAAVDAKVVELMSLEVPEDAPAAEAIAFLHEAADGKGAAVIGPGLGVDSRGRDLARAMALELPIPVVVDADALTAFQDDPATLQAATGPRVLTPHPGEAARLLGIGVPEVQGDRFTSARALADQTGATVVLKGAGTLVTGPGVGFRACLRGTPALGVGGTGDVLAGLVGAMLLGTGDRLAEAATAAVLLHAVAGEQAAVGDRGLMAGEVADALPSVIARLRGVPPSTPPGDP